ncbi:hypothetical protein [Shimia sp. W99]
MISLNKRRQHLDYSKLNPETQGISDPFTSNDGVAGSHRSPFRQVSSQA